MGESSLLFVGSNLIAHNITIEKYEKRGLEFENIKSNVYPFLHGTLNMAYISTLIQNSYFTVNFLQFITKNFSQFLFSLVSGLFIISCFPVK